MNTQKSKGLNRQSAAEREALLHDTITVDICRYTRIKTHTIKTLRVNCNVKSMDFG